MIITKQHKTALLIAAIFASMNNAGATESGTGSAAKQSAQSRLIVNSVKFEGNTVFSSDELRTLVGDMSGEQTIESLNQMAQKVAQHYQQSGYPFTVATIPPQKVTNGTVVIRVLEGRYGDIKVTGSAGSDVRDFVYDIVPGDIINSDKLDRTMLILSSIPGIKVAGSIRPGKDTGTSDLVIFAEKTKRFDASVGIDNHGNKYTNKNRLSASVNAYSTFLFGDEIKASAISTGGGLNFGDVKYTALINSSGLRAGAKIARSTYEIGKEFSVLGASGSVDTVNVQASYPLIYSSSTKVIAGLNVDRNTMKDKQAIAQTSTKRRSNTISVRLDLREEDGFGGGGITAASAVYTLGKLKMSEQLAEIDEASGEKTRGRFSKVTLDVTRAQSTPLKGIWLFGRLKTQIANKNLDNSESINIGGAGGLRGLSPGDLSGDEGWVAQIEVRGNAGAFSPYAFYDYGKVKVNAKNDQLVYPLAKNSVSAGSIGAGVRYSKNGLNVDFSIAKSIKVEKQKTQALLSVNYQF